MALNAALDRHPDIVAKILESTKRQQVESNIPSFENGLKEFLALRLNEKHMLIQHSRSLMRTVRNTSRNGEIFIAQKLRSICWPHS